MMQECGLHRGDLEIRHSRAHEEEKEDPESKHWEALLGTHTEPTGIVATHQI